MLYLEGVESNRRNIMLRNNSMAVTFQGELVVPPIKTIFLSNSTFRIDEIENQIEELLLRKNRFRFFYFFWFGMDYVLFRERKT
jgi:hypothetical protein